MSDPRAPMSFQVPDSGPPISRARLATVLWLVCEGMVFAAVLGAFVVARRVHAQWPDPYEGPGGIMTVTPRVHLMPPTVNAGLLISAFIIALLAQQAARQGDYLRCRVRLRSVAILGILFCGIVAWELFAEAGRGITMRSGQYGAYWVMLTVMHALHVLAGVIWLFVLITGRLALPVGGVDAHRVEHLSLYWGFITFVWLILLVLLHVL